MLVPAFGVGSLLPIASPVGSDALYANCPAPVASVHEQALDRFVVQSQSGAVPAGRLNPEHGTIDQANVDEVSHCTVHATLLRSAHPARQRRFHDVPVGRIEHAKVNVVAIFFAALSADGAGIFRSPDLLLSHQRRSTVRQGASAKLPRTTWAQ